MAVGKFETVVAVPPRTRRHARREGVALEFLQGVPEAFFAAVHARKYRTPDETGRTAIIEATKKTMSSNP